MKKRTLYTNFTPLPSNIPRQLAVDMLHNHGEIIELSPLVLEHHPVEAPKNAAADEYFAVWHEITERIQFLPGMGKMASSKISFKGVFHDMPWGLQTHIYAPMGVETRQKLQIRGNQPGEPREIRELGETSAPHEGLYLREDVEITCNRAMAGFVKKELKAGTRVLVDRLMKKAELLDAGALDAMLENGRLKTINPAVRNSFAARSQGSGSPQFPSQFARQPLSPQMLSSQMDSPRMLYPEQSSFHDRQLAHHSSVRGLGLQDDAKRQSGFAPYQDQGYYHNAGAYARQSQYTAPPQGRQFVAELSGSTYYMPQESPNLQNPNRTSTLTELSGSSPNQNSFPSPNMGSSEQSTAASELPAN